MSHDPRKRRGGDPREHKAPRQPNVGGPATGAQSGVKDGLDEEQLQRDLGRYRVDRANEEKGLYQIMTSPMGRAWIWKLLDHLGFLNPLPVDPYAPAMGLKLSERNAQINECAWIWRECESVCPEELERLLAESIGRRAVRDRVEAKLREIEDDSSTAESDEE